MKGEGKKSAKRGKKTTQNHVNGERIKMPEESCKKEVKDTIETCILRCGNEGQKDRTVAALSKAERKARRYGRQLSMGKEGLQS